MKDRKTGIGTKLSFLIMGLGNVIHGQYGKGILFFAVEVAYVWFMLTAGINCLAMLPSLGDRKQEEIWN